MFFSIILVPSAVSVTALNLGDNLFTTLEPTDEAMNDIEFGLIVLGVMIFAYVVVQVVTEKLPEDKN